MQLKLLRSLFLTLLFFSLVGCFLLDDGGGGDEKLSNDATLSNLSIAGYTIPFNSGKFLYELEVDNSVDSISISAQTNHSKASISQGLGGHNLSVGENEIKIRVLAENKTTSNVYKIVIIRKNRTLDSNTYLSKVESSISDWNIGFNKDVISYYHTVSNDIKEITINSEVESLTSTVTGNGYYQLKTGENIIELVVKAEDGISSKTYSFYINRENLPDVNNNAILSGLSVTNFTLNETFQSNKTLYSLNVTTDINSIIIEATVSDSTLSIAGDGVANLKYGLNTITIQVSSQDNTEVTKYTMEVIRDYPPLPDDNSKLSSLSIENHTLDQEFNSDVNKYSLKVVESVDNITISATANQETSSIKGLGLHILDYGYNSIEIEVTAENGINKSKYIIEVIREKSIVNNDSPKLKSLSLQGVVLNEAFNSSVTSYSAVVSHDVENINIVAEADNTSHNVTGLGQHSLKYGKNSFNIEVTDEDDRKSVYTLEIIRTNPPVLDNNSQLSSLELEGYSFNEEFNPSILTYTATVDSDVKTVKLLGTALKLSSQVEGLGEFDLSIGLNEFSIIVTAEDGETKSTYSVKITREQPAVLDSNSSLSNIVIDGHSLNEIFHSAILNYTVTVADTVNKINIRGIREKDTSEISGNGEITLNTKVTIVKLEVTAQDGINKTDYTVVITKMDPYIPDSNSSLSDLSVPGYIFNTIFDPAVKQYSLTVNHDIESINVNATAYSVKSSITGSGSVNLDYGTNTIHINVLAENGINTSLYTLTVNRNNPPVVDDSSLNSLSVSIGQLSPIFNPNQLNYSVGLLHEQNKITILSEANVSTSVITGNGEYDLIVGDNRIEIKVLAADNISETTYVITVNRGEYIPSDNSNLSSLSIYGIAFDQDFSPSTLSYTAEVPYTTSSINILATKEHNLATIESGPGTESLIVGDNTFNIVVKAENTVSKTYTIIVTRLEAGITSTFNFVTPADETITLNSIGNAFNVNDTFSVNIDEDFDSYRWFVGTVDQLNSSKNITIDCSNLEPGNHRLLAVVTKDGRAYSKFLYFTISNN